jgi:heme oxygenase (biliverdin-IX-beta and delta-forming)
MLPAPDNTERPGLVRNAKPNETATGSAPPMVLLRRATAAAHGRLDSGLAVTDPHLTADDYRRFLGRMFGVVAPTEAAIGAADVPLDDWDGRRRTWMLAEDLGEEAAGLPWCRAAQVPMSPARALGAAYVLEGSTLGGVHVAAAVRASVGPHAPVRWFESHGDQVPLRWQGFRQQVNAWVDDDGDLDEVVAGANHTFEVMCDWLLEAEV